MPCLPFPVPWPTTLWLDFFQFLELWVFGYRVLILVGAFWFFLWWVAGAIFLTINLSRNLCPDSWNRWTIELTCRSSKKFSLNMHQIRFLVSFCGLIMHNDLDVVCIIRSKILCITGDGVGSHLGLCIKRYSVSPAWLDIRLYTCTIVDFQPPRTWMDVAGGARITTIPK